MSPLNDEVKSPQHDWIAEAEELQQKLLAAATEGTPALRQRLMARLVPSDFLDEQRKQQFTTLRDEWHAQRVCSKFVNQVGDYSMPNPECDAMVGRLAKLAGAIRTTALLRRSLREIENNFASYEAVLEGASRETTAESVRLAILKATPLEWETPNQRTIDALETLEHFAVRRDLGTGRRVGWGGLSTLDRLTDELQPGGFFLIGAAPGHGKSAFLIALARAAASAKRRVGIISLRDSEENLRLRIFGAALQVDPVDLRKADFTHKDFVHLTGVAARLSDHFPASAALRNTSVGEICGFIRQLAAVEHLHLLLVDDFDACKTDPVESADSLMEKINQISVLARELMLPLVVTTSLDTEGIFHASKGSIPATWEVLHFANADFFAILKREADEEFPAHKLHILRNAFGPTATLPLFFNKMTQQYYEVAE